MVAHVPVAARIVVEPVVPDGWVRDIGHPTAQTPNGTRWIKYPSLRSVIAGDGSLDPANGQAVNIEDYERTLSPALIGYYEQQGYCWVVTGSTQAGRAQADPRPGAAGRGLLSRARSAGRRSSTAPRPTRRGRDR